MKTKLILALALFSSTLTYSKEFTCEEVTEREISTNSNTTVKVRKINGTCSFVVETSRDRRKFSYSQKEYEASREWIFQNNGKILIHNSYDTGPTDSSGTSYKGYQLFPNNQKLKLHLNTDGTFSMRLPSGANVFFNKDGSIDSTKTTDLNLKDKPIKIPNIPKEKSSKKYEELGHLSYRDSRKSSIRIYHRQLYASATSRSIGLETSSGMYIPLGTEMGKIPGNNTGAAYTLYGVNDKKLCKEKMPAHYFFNYLVRCSSRSPNSRCACKYSEEESQKLFAKNTKYDKEIRQINFLLRTGQAKDQDALKERLQELTKLYNPNLYSEVYFTCSLDRSEALSFIAGKKISRDNREIEGVAVKETSKVIDGLIDSRKCKNLKKAYRDCAHCFDRELINVDSIEKQNKDIEEVLNNI